MTKLDVVKTAGGYLVFLFFVLTISLIWAADKVMVLKFMGTDIILIVFVALIEKSMLHAKNNP